MPDNSRRVVEITTEQTYALRISVLRRDTANKDPKYSEDSQPETVHLGIFANEKSLIGTSTWAVKPFVADPNSRAVQLRGMAVDTTHQSNGLGKLMLQAGVDRAKENGAKYVWAKARDSALNFYLRNGFSVHGEGFTEEVTQLPHHIVVYKVN